MYHVIEMEYGDTLTYTITKDITELVDRFAHLEIPVKSVYCDPDFEVVKKEWLRGYGVKKENYPNKAIHLFVGGHVYSDPFESCWALDYLAPRVLGWRVRRFGNRLGLLGVYLRRRRWARRSRRRERRLKRSARRIGRRAKRAERRADLARRRNAFCSWLLDKVGL